MCPVRGNLWIALLSCFPERHRSWLKRLGISCALQAGTYGSSLSPLPQRSAAVRILIPQFPTPYTREPGSLHSHVAIIYAMHAGSYGSALFLAPRLSRRIEDGTRMIRQLSTQATSGYHECLSRTRSLDVGMDGLMDSWMDGWMRVCRRRCC